MTFKNMSTPKDIMHQMVNLIIGESNSFTSYKLNVPDVVLYIIVFECQACFINMKR